MALVKTETTIFGNRYIARYNVSKDGVFSVNLPEWSHTALGKEKLTGKTLEDVVSQFAAERIRYAEIRQATADVIIYRFNLQNVTGRYGAKDERDDIGFGVGKGIQYAVANAIETQHFSVDGELIRKSYVAEQEQPYPEGYNHGKFGCLIWNNRNFQAMPWTQEREDWFLSLCKAMDGLIGKIKTLDEQQPLLLAAIEDQKLLKFS